MRGMSRRQFMSRGMAAAGAAALAGCPPPAPEGAVRVWRRSGRGRRVSNAAKKHAANFLYTTMAAARQNFAHPGDNTTIVSLFISREDYNFYFLGGARDTVDLRKV